MPVQMELHKIIIVDMQDMQTIVLKEVDGPRKFAIVIGPDVASAISRRVNEIKFPRPLTHDLMHSLITGLGAKLERIDIVDLRDQTYFANLVLRQGKKHVTIDSRPSDAIALGLFDNVPIFVAEHVLQAAGQPE
jgi:uncharacterized protein